MSIKTTSLTNDTLLSRLTRFVGELEAQEAKRMHAVPAEVMNAVKKAKSLEKLVHDIFTQVSGNGRIQLASSLRREFGIKAELMDHFRQWAPYSKEQFEDALHDAIDRAEIRAGNQGVFFAGTPSKKEAAEALECLLAIAHAAIRCQFHSGSAPPEAYVDILANLLKFYALPHTYPEGSGVQYRNLVSADRLHAMSGGDHQVTEALKEYARGWYQQSNHTFLESRESYVSYEYVPDCLYALTEEQLERLRGDYIRYAEEEFTAVRAKPDLHRARQLKSMLEAVLGWAV